MIHIFRPDFILLWWQVNIVLGCCLHVVVNLYLKHWWPRTNVDLSPARPTKGNFKKHPPISRSKIAYLIFSPTLPGTNELNTPRWSDSLTHWGRVTHICVSKLAIIGSDDLYPGRRQAIIWTNAGILKVPTGQEKVKIWKKVRKFLYGWGIFEIHQNARKKSGKFWYERFISNFMVNVMMWSLGLSVADKKCKKVRKHMSIVFGHIVNQAIIKRLWHIEMENHIYFLPDDCHNIFFFNLCDPCEFLWKSNYHIFMLQKVSKNWDLKKSVNFIARDSCEC